MLPTGTVPCEPWPFIWCCPELPNPNPDPLIQAVLDDAVLGASQLLYSRTAQQFGLCEVTLRPCRRDCDDMWRFGNWFEWTPGRQWPFPALIDGAWFNLGCGSCTGGCSCKRISEALLPGPVHDITEVKVDGLVLPASSYRVDNHRLLVRTDGGVWPRCQDLNLDDDQPGTWSATPVLGEEVPDLGQRAVGELACEWAKACLGQECRLPSPIQQIVRQNVSVTFLDPNELFEGGRIGLYFPDLFISTYNPERLRQRPQAYDIDNPPWRRTNT